MGVKQSFVALVAAATGILILVVWAEAVPQHRGVIKAVLLGGLLIGLISGVVAQLRRRSNSSGDCREDGP